MNDLKDVLGLALSEAGGPAAGEIADPGADLARGRRLLRRRRLLGAGGVAAAMAVGALVPLALQSGAGPASHPPAAAVKHGPASTPKPKAVPSSAAATGHVALVAWTGTQPPGYQVSWMPSNWVVQGSTPYALTIAPPGDPDKSPDSFIGKLVVMLQSQDATSLPPGTSQPVNGRRGVFQTAAQAGGNTEVLTFQVAGGRWAVVQAPMSLGWDSAELAKFASGVQVLNAAEAGHG